MHHTDIPEHPHPHKHEKSTVNSLWTNFKDGVYQQMGVIALGGLCLFVGWFGKSTLAFKDDLTVTQNQSIALINATKKELSEESAQKLAVFQTYMENFSKDESTKNANFLDKLQTVVNQLNHDDQTIGFMQNQADRENQMTMQNSKDIKDLQIEYARISSLSNSPQRQQ